jgi:hypothetical protein
MDLSQWQVVAMGAAMAIGWFLKSKTGFKNQAIPLVTFAIQFLQQLLGQLGPAEGVVTAGVVTAGFSINIGALLSPAINAFLQTLLVTGLHSGSKAIATIRK